MKSANLFVSLWFAVVFITGCTNKSKVAFSDLSGYNTPLAFSNSKIEIEDGAQVTNKKIVKVSFKKIPDNFLKFRMGNTADLTAEAWKSFVPEDQFDLGAQWAGDGSKDGNKTIYFEFKSSDVNFTFPMQASIGLDTVAPEITIEGLLVNGIQGQVFRSGQNVPLQWSAVDVSKPAGGFTSGLSSKTGLKVGWSSASDCSSGVTDVQAWGPYASSTSKFRWPNKSSLEAFYICIYVQDKAGNISTALSQPMVSFWKVLAVDNSQGNGGSVRAGNVRFANPQNISADSKGNIFLTDPSFRNIRKIDVNKNISLVAGNGSTSCPVEGAAANEVGLGTPYYMRVDPQDRVVFISCNNIWRLEADSGGVLRMHALNITAVNTQTSFTWDTSGQNMFLGTFSKWAYNDVNSNAYIFKIPMSQVGTKIFDINTLKGGYILVGNGIIPNMPKALTNPYTPPTTITLSKTDPADFDHSVGDVVGLATSPDGRIFFSTHITSNGQALGNLSVRELKPLAGGKYLQTIIDVNVNAANLQYIITADQEEYLMINGVYDHRRYVYKSNSGKTGMIKNILGEAFDTDDAAKNYKRDSVMVLDPVTRFPAYLVATQSLNSKLLVYDTNFQPLERWGRELADTSSVTTQTVLNAPTGIATDSAGNTYVVDTQNGLLKVIGADGLIRNFGGGSGPDKILVNAPLSELTYNGNSIFSGHDNFHFSMLEAGGEKTLYFSSMSSRASIYQIDLNQQTVTTLGAGNSRNCSDPKSWEPTAIASRIESGVKTVYVLRKWLYYTDLDPNCLGTGIAGLSAVITRIQGNVETIIAGQNVYKQVQYGLQFNEGALPANALLYHANGLEIDSNGYLYFSAASNKSVLRAINLNDLSQPVLTLPTTRIGFTKISIMEEGNIRHVFGATVGSLYYVKVDLSNLTQSAKVEKLCIPGTFISRIGDIAKTASGQLQMTDQENQRIIEYVVQKDGVISLNYCN